MSSVPKPTSMASDKVSSDIAVCSETLGKKNDDENNTYPKNNHNTCSDATLTDSVKSVITLSNLKLNNLLTKLNVAKVHITPLVDIILQAASACSETEFKELIRSNEPVCCVPNNQYIRAFTAAQILYDVNTELLQHHKSRSAIYSMNIQNSFNVNPAIDYLLNGSNLATNDIIYIDRDTMKQLLELHELVTETINKLQTAETIKTETLQINYKDKKKCVQNVNSKILTDSTKFPQKTLKETTSSQDQCCCSKLLEVPYTMNCKGNKKEIKKDERPYNEPKIIVSNKPFKNVNNSNNKGVGKPQCSGKNILKCMCKKQDIPKNQQNEIEAQNITSTEEQHDKPVANIPLASQLPNEVEVTENVKSASKDPVKESVDNLPNKLLIMGMLPNEEQRSITPSDTVLRNFAGMSVDRTEKSPKRKGSSNTDKNIAMPRNKSKGDSTDKENQSPVKKDKLDKKKSPNENEPIKADKLRKKQKNEKADQFEEPIPQERVVEPNSKKKNKSKVSIKGEPIDAINTNKNNPEPLQEQMNEFGSKTEEIRTKKARAEIKTNKKSNMSYEDNKMRDNENVDDKKLPNELSQQVENKKLSPNKKLKDKKSNKKLQETTEKEMMADSDYPTVSEAAGEMIASTPKNSNKEIKDGEKAKNERKNDNKMKKIAKENDKLDKGKQNEKKKKKSSKELKSSKKNESVNTISDPYLPTIMQAPSMHIQNNDLATNKQFFQTEKKISTARNKVNTNDEEINPYPINLSTYIEGTDAPIGNKDEVNQKVIDNNTKDSAANVINRESNQLNDVGQKLDNISIAHHNSGNSVVNHETVMNTEDEIMKQSEEEQPQQTSFFHRVEENKLQKPSELSNNAQKVNQPVKTVKQNQLQNKAIVIRENEHQSIDISDNNQTSHSIIERTKAISKELFSAIRRGISPSNQDCHCNINKFPQNNQDEYNNIADATVALLQCLNELTKIRKYISVCDDPELRILEQSANIQILQHDNNCGMDDAPHIHCNLQGIELTLRTDKNLYAASFPEIIQTNQKDVSSNAEAPLLVKPINSNSNTNKVTNIKTTNGEQAQTSVGDSSISWSNKKQTTQADTSSKDLVFQPIPSNDTRMSDEYKQKKLFPQYHEFDPKFLSSLIESTKPNHMGATTKQKDLVKSIEDHDSSTGIPYVVGIKSLPKMDDNLNTSESMIISVESMKNFLDTETLYHKDERVNKAINSIHINHLLLSCAPVNCSIKTCLNDRRDLPDLPLKASLTSLPLSATDLVVIRQNIERKSNIPINDNLPSLRESNCNHHTFEYYTNFQANFSSNREYFVPRVYLVYYFEIHRDDKTGDNHRRGKPPPKRRTHLTSTTTQQPQEEDLDAEPDRKWSDFKIFDYLRKEFMLLRGDGLLPKTSNAINVKTSKGKHNKKIQVSLTKTIEIPIKSRRRSSHYCDGIVSTKRPSKRYIATTATQTFSYCKINDTRIDQEIMQKQRTLHTQTITHSSSTKSLANILLDTIYETDFETSLKKPVQHIYNMSEVIHTPSSLLEELRSIPKEFTVETSQYEINTTAKPSISMISNTNLTCNKQLNHYRHIHPSFIPRRTIDASKAKLDAKRNIAGPGSMTARINKRCANRYNRIEKKQSISSNSTYMSPETSALHRVTPLTESSSDCDDVFPVASRKFVSASSSNLSQSKLISSSPKRQSPRSKRNIVRDKIKNLPVYNSESLGATLSRYQSYVSSELDQYPSQVKFGSGSKNHTSVASSVFNLPKKHSCGFLSVLSPSCGCPDVTVFIPCFCNEQGCTNKSSKNSKSLDILNKGVSGMYHVIMPPVDNSKPNN